ncbi:heparinase II/III family protein [Caulobacter sp. 17J80-11]|uniref:heparinase II/III domain-containing protein n=1 Tax=Caulobacter sp. 17J80-11 TaxID=2763502 RepID=UPI001653C576|nr:heparinase II/III family protein [Caulobacter sp. 17J80-11]MBC6983423.1 alginate lyase family protein [Caulobacter sp. 17J80-11]
MTRAPLVSVLALALLCGAAPVNAGAPSPAAAAPKPEFAAWTDAPLFAAEVERAKADVAEAMRQGVVVPVPKDPGGGYTHEQHKRNYRTIYQAGQLYRLTGDPAYAEHVRKLLLAYAELYPKLGPHPAGRGDEIAGRLFWQTLNDSVWLVNAVQGYEAIRPTLSPADRKTIEEQVFRRMARFLSDENPRNFNRIHNHATWAVAGVGMTGYVLGDSVLVDKALRGLNRDGQAGFLRQIDQLFSPDGYYEEGAYYQRYALMPFVVFAREIDRRQPELKIFERRDGVLLKAIRTTVQMSYADRLLPINDAIKDKGLDTEELHHGVAIAYALTGDPSLLSVARTQGHTVLTPDGLRVARDLAAGKAKPFPFASVLLRDGPDGMKGALAILRTGDGPRQTALVAKNTSQGMGHGHFDKLNWLFFDNGQEIVRDYGSARFLNVEAKSGGVYLPENTSWAKQTVAHNTLVVNETTHFDGVLKRAEAAAPEQIFFEAGGPTQITSARMAGAYDGVVFTRTQALLQSDLFAHPIVVDLLKVHGPQPARYDLPLHYQGHIIEVGFPLQSKVAERPVLGTANGYQHLWVDALGAPSADDAQLTWMHENRFYTWRFLPQPGATAVLAESGANDPNFNLRREPVLIQRVDGAADATFVGVLEPHGLYDGAAETTVGSHSRIAKLERFASDDADVIVITTREGRRLALGVAQDAAPNARHTVKAGERSYSWTGFYGRFDD